MPSLMLYWQTQQLWMSPVHILLSVFGGMVGSLEGCQALTAQWIPKFFLISSPFSFLSGKERLWKQTLCASLAFTFLFSISLTLWAKEDTHKPIYYAVSWVQSSVDHCIALVYVSVLFIVSGIIDIFNVNNRK